jgi:hypothetical protein
MECGLPVCMEMPLASVWTVGRILYVFDIEEFNGHRSVPKEYEHSSSKNRGPSDRPQYQNDNFPESGHNDLVKF